RKFPRHFPKLSQDFAATGSLLSTMSREPDGLARINFNCAFCAKETTMLRPIWQLIILSFILISNPGSAVRTQMLYASSAASYVDGGCEFYQKGDRERTPSDFYLAEGFDPQTALAYYNRGVVHCARQEYARALKDFDPAIQPNPRLAQAWVN